MTITIIDAVREAALAIPVREASQAVADKHDAFEAGKAAYIVAEANVKLPESTAASARHDQDPVALVEAVETADRGLRTAKVALTVAASQVKNAREVHALTLHNSLEAVHAQARAARLAACQRADNARAELAGAEVDFHSANQQLQEVYSAGRRRMFDGALLALHVERDAGIVLHVPSVEVDSALWADFAVQA